MLRYTKFYSDIQLVVNVPHRTDVYQGVLFTIKKNKIMFFSGKWMEMENFMSSESSQAQKVKDRMFFFICGSLTYKLS
jgi:putative lipase involved disintegration of autophagic bodies